MSGSDKDNQLLHFIETKQDVSTILNERDLYYIFTKSIRNSFVKTYEQLNNIEYSIHCSNIVVSIFWIVLSYTNNLKLTLFLCERAIILFIEYITLSRTMMNSEPINITDVKLFIYRKTVGPINIYKHTKQTYFKDIEELSILTKDLLTYIFTEYIVNNILPITILEDICCLLCGVMYTLTKCGQVPFIKKNIIHLYEFHSLNIQNRINMTKVRFELYLHVLNMDNIDKAYQYYTQMLNEFELPNEYKETLFNVDININDFL